MGIVGCAHQQTMPNPSTDLLKSTWSEATQQAKGTTVSIYMWGGSDSINRYMDEWVAPRLKKETGVTLKRVPINDTKDIINKLWTEKQAGKERGSVDIIWINGENFKTAKDQGLLWGPFAEKLPNVQRYIDMKSADIRLDFGEETNNLEAPWGKAQFVFVYDQNKVQNPPKSMKELKEWIKKNPGKFTYPAPPDFTGSAFIRQALYETAGGYQQVLSVDEKGLDQKSSELWTFLMRSNLICGEKVKHIQKA
jgi:putative spermidine/putrescine transport system substrate-binding protein